MRCQNGETFNVHGETTSFFLQLCDAYTKSLTLIMFLPDSLARLCLKKSPNKRRQTGNYFCHVMEVSAIESKLFQLWRQIHTTDIYFWMHLRNYGRYARSAVSSWFVFLTGKFLALFAMWRAIFRSRKSRDAAARLSWVTRRSQGCTCRACTYNGGLCFVRCLRFSSSTKPLVQNHSFWLILSLRVWYCRVVVVCHWPITWS